MESVLSIDELLDQVNSKYILVTLVAKRARELIEGSEPLINVQHYQQKSLKGRIPRAIQEETQEKLKPTTIALLEILEGKASYQNEKEEY